MPRIFADQLSTHLANRLNKIYYLVGQDPLLIDESKQAIKQAAQQQQFDESYEIAIDSSTDWNSLFERCQSLGLFFTRQIIILNLPDNLTAPINKNLTELIASLNEDIILILQFHKFAKSNEKQGWYQASLDYDPQLLQINCQTPTIEQYPRWISLRAKAMGLQLEPEATQLLSHSYENNLLALKQTLQLLSLLYPEHKLTYPLVKQVVEQASVFTPYQWMDALLEGKEKRAKRILVNLQQEDIQPVVLVRILQRELLILLELAQPQHKIHLTDPLPSQQLKAHFDRLKIWQTRRPLFIAILQRLNYQKLFMLFQQLAQIERSIKQEFSHDIWQQLEDITIKICSGG